MGLIFYLIFQHPSLCRFPSYAFYEKQLVTKKSPKLEVFEPLSIWRDHKNPLIFCHTEGEEEYLTNISEEGNVMSKYNKAEIDQVVHLMMDERERERESFVQFFKLEYPHEKILLCCNIY